MLSFGQQATATPSLFGATTTTTPSLFGGTMAKPMGTAAPTFGGFGTVAPQPIATTTSSGLFGFGATATPAQPSFGGFGFGTLAPATSTTSLGFGGFGATPATGIFTGANPAAGGLFANQQQQHLQQQQQLQQQQAANNLSNMATAVSMPQIFNDERDNIIAKLNQLKAFWGTGKGFFSQNGAVEFKPDNPFCRFKAIGYSCLPTTKNEQGLVFLTIGQKESNVRGVQQQFIDALHRVLGSKPTLSVCVEGIKPLPDDKTEIIIYILERPQSGPARRIPATEFATFLNQNNIKPLLMSQLKVEQVLPKTGLDSEQLKEYLDKPPAGIDPILWQQAKLDNPDPDKMIPVPMIGFKELQTRLKHQTQQTNLHQNKLDIIGEDLSSLQRNHANMLAKLEEYKRRELELGHRVLQVIVKQEIYRKMGYAVQADEEQLRVQLEAIQAELNHPTQFKGRLNEMMSQIRMQNQLQSSRSDISYQMDPALQQEVKQLLRQQQEGLQHLIKIIKEDSDNLKIIEHGLAQSSAVRR